MGGGIKSRVKYYSCITLGSNLMCNKILRLEICVYGERVSNLWYLVTHLNCTKTNRLLICTPITFHNLIKNSFSIRYSIDFFKIGEWQSLL